MSCVKPFLSLVVPVLYFGRFALSLQLASYAFPLSFDLLNYILDFVLSKHCNALMFVLITLIIGSLAFLSSKCDQRRQRTRAVEDRPPNLMGAFGGRKGAVGEMSDLTTATGCRDGLKVEESTSDPSTDRAGGDKWFTDHSADECSVEEHFSFLTVWESVVDDQINEDQGNFYVQPQVVSALSAQQKENSCCINYDIKANSSASEVLRLQATAGSQKMLHSSLRSRSYSSIGLSLSDEMAAETDPSLFFNYRSASFSCYRGSSPQSLMDKNSEHASLHSPPLPPFAFDMLDKSCSSSSEMNAFASQKPFDDVEAANRSKKPHDRIRLYGDQAFKSKSRRRRKAFELQQRSDAFIAQQLQQWKLERQQNIDDHKG